MGGINTAFCDEYSSATYSHREMEACMTWLMHVVKKYDKLIDEVQEFNKGLIRVEGSSRSIRIDSTFFKLRIEESQTDYPCLWDHKFLVAPNDIHLDKTFRLQGFCSKTSLTP